MLKKILFPLFYISVLFCSAQELPYQWKVQFEAIGDDEIELNFICTIDSSWHIYSKDLKGELGVPTTVEIEYSSNYEILSDLKEPQPIIQYDEIVEGDVAFHEGKVVFSQRIRRTTENAFLVNTKIVTQACQESGVCTRPEEIVQQIEIKSGESLNKGVFWFFVAGLIAGFFALLTPCVFPMIPLTVTFFTKQAETKSKGILKAFVYGVSIIVIYVSLGFGVSTLLGEEVLNNMASSAVFNLFFFAVLLVFAISFLGVFEITLPAFLVNKVDSKADKGGWIGIFFMAFALALVSFSCTGPLIGTLLVEAAVNGGAKAPLLGMLGFSTALALPFTLFAIFPNWLSNLPKSGSWLNSVKVTLGFLEIALALKFLSNADLVYQLGWLPREVFIGIWIIIFSLLFFYLMGLLRFKHDAPIKKLSSTRKLIAFFFLSVVIYLIPGLWGKPLRLLSGVLPPTHYTIFQVDKVDSEGRPLEHCPNNLNCYHDFETALAIAKDENKPLLLDFTGWTCVNCRYVEQNIWSDLEIDSLIRNHYVLASLYVDDRNKLPTKMQKKSIRTGKSIVTYGDLWADFEVSRFGEFTQPLYVLLDTNNQLLVPKQSYTTSIKKYKVFLEEGLREFKNSAVAK